MEASRTLRSMRVPDPEAGPLGQVPIGELASVGAAVPAGSLVSEVADLFFQDRTLEALALVRGYQPVGVLTRGRLLLRLARNFGKELYGRKPVERIADMEPVILAEDVPVVDAITRALARPAETVYDEIVVARADGSYAGMIGIRDLVLHQGVALARSKARREAAEARTRDLERLERLRGQFLAHATHELRSPVNAIVALGELLRLHAERGNVEGVRERAVMLLRSAAALRGTVNNILDLSKLEAGKSEVVISRVEVAPLLDELAATTRLLVGDRPIEVECSVEAGLAVETDRQKLRQMVLNLASNAAKFTDRGRVSLGAAATAEGVCVRVSDTGIGIRPEDLESLFVPFGQLEDALTQAHEGSGLGLVITRSLAHLVGGRVGVTSRHGEGSTFEIVLPANPPASAEG